MQSKWRFRSATLQDSTRLEEIETSSFAMGVRESLETLSERISLFPEGFIVVTEEGTDQPVGYISSEIWHENTELTIESLCVGHSIRDLHDRFGLKLYISSIAILPSFRGLRLGEALLNQLVERIRRCYPRLDRALLVVCEDWESARRLYKRCGFTELNSIEGVYQQEESEPQKGIVMERRF